MLYNDENISTPENFEKMAKAYSDSLKEQGFVFFKINEEDYSLLLTEVFDILFKLRASYRFLGGFLESDKFLSLTEKQIDYLRTLFSYNKNQGYIVKTNNTKCFLNNISLESVLILKLNILAQKSEYFQELSSLVNERLTLMHENYNIEGIFTNQLNKL